MAVVFSYFFRFSEELGRRQKAGEVHPQHCGGIFFVLQAAADAAKAGDRAGFLFLYFKHAKVIRQMFELKTQAILPSFSGERALVIMRGLEVVIPQFFAGTSWALGPFMEGGGHSNLPVGA